jgi:hypothetical protein
MTPETRPVRYRVELFGLLTLGSPEGVKVRVLDLSETGAFLEQPELPEDPQEGDAVTLALAFPGIGKWTAKGAITRLGRSRLELKRPKAAHVTVVREGFGIEFVALDDEALEQLRDFLELLDQR